MGSTVDDIKARISIVEVLQERMRLRRVGANWMGSCPFHADRTPSFSVSPDKGVWHCFSCNRGGDLFTFVMEMEGLEFRDALEQLANRAGVPIRYERPEERSQRSRLLALHEQAVKYFTQALRQSKGGLAALEYLKKRGLKNKTLEDFKLGYAPYAWDGLVRALKGRGFSESEIVASGLAIRREGTVGERGLYDRFRARIMFPIANTHGEVIAFSGRIFPEGMPLAERARAEETGKYINSPNTAIYEKKRVLYGFDRAKAAIRQAKAAVLLEGNVDIVLSHQAGVANAVATCGTALGEEHLTQLKALADEIVFCFDRDAAGQTATRRALGSALASGFKVSAVVLPEGVKDPADVVSASPSQWPALVKAKQEIMAFFLGQARQQFAHPDAESKRVFAEYLFEPLATVPNHIVRAHWLQTIAAELRLPETSVTDDFQAYVTKRRRDAPYMPPLAASHLAAAPRTFQRECEQNITAIILRFPALASVVPRTFTVEAITDLLVREIFETALGYARAHTDSKVDWQKVFPDQAPVISQLQLRAEHFFPDEPAAREELAKALAFLHNERYKSQLKTASLALEEAVARGDAPAAAAAEQHINSILHTLRNLPKFHDDTPSLGKEKEVKDKVKKSTGQKADPRAGPATRPRRAYAKASKTPVGSAAGTTFEKKDRPKAGPSRAG